MSFVMVRTFAPGRYAEGGVPWECMYERAGSQKALRIEGTVDSDSEPYDMLHMQS